ncbi:MAG: TolC family protein [Gemmatimonadota bacterium]
MKSAAAFLPALLLFLVPPVAAQDVSRGDLHELTLEEAIRRAEIHNPALRQITNSLELNALDRRDAWLQILPQPSLTFLSTSMSWSRQTIAEDNFGEPLPRDVVEWVQTSRSNQSISMAFTLDAADFLRLRVQREEAREREIAVSTETHQLRAELTQAYLEAQEQGAALEVEEELLVAARANRDLAERLYALARQDRIDLVSLELSLAEQEHALDQSRREMESALLALRNLIGDPDLPSFRIVPVELEFFDPEALDPEALVGIARQQNPSVLQAEAGLRAQRRSVDMVRADWWLPTLSVNMSTGRQGFVRGGEAFFDPNPDGEWDRSVFVSIRLPDVGQYFNRQGQERRTALEIRNQEEGLRQVRGELEEEIRGHVNTLRSAARQLEIQGRRAELAEEQLRLAREAYGLGSQSYLDLLNAQEQAAAAGREVVTARYSFEQARVALERAVGLSIGEMLELSSGGGG